MTRLWHWLRYDAGLRLHGFCFALALFDSLLGRWAEAAFWMATAAYWLKYDTPAATLTIHVHDCIGAKLTVVADDSPTPRGSRD